MRVFLYAGAVRMFSECVHARVSVVGRGVCLCAGTRSRRLEKGKMVGNKCLNFTSICTGPFCASERVLLCAERLRVTCLVELNGCHLNSTWKLSGLSDLGSHVSRHAIISIEFSLLLMYCSY